MTTKAQDQTKAELQTLRHMLGIDDPTVKIPKPYRDYYCAPRGDANLAEMAGRGLVVLYSQRDGYDWYQTTEAGRRAAIASHRAIRYGKGQRVYIRFLEARDAIPDLTFRDFLIDRRYREMRAEA